MLEYLRSTHELGIFAAIASLGMIASLITTALSRSALPRFAQLFANGAFGQFKRLLFKLMGLGILIAVMGAVGTAIFGKAFLTIAYTEEYARHSEVLIVVMANVGLIATFSFLGTALSATQQFVVQVPIHIVKILVVVIFSYLLIPYFGILGAAWAMLISSLTSGLIYGFIFWRTIRRSQYEL
jgi:O-antigen/teichoic acid export membrane protein